ncbi:Vacuolar protein-sorting-associated protein 28 [Lecanora helva]
MLASPKQQAYAPTPYRYMPNSAVSSTFSLDKVKVDKSTTNCVRADSDVYQEVKLSETASERDLNDSLAEIYSIIITLDGLEKAYIKDSIPETEYTDLCGRLLKQYKSNLSDETVARDFVDLETFKHKWDIECPRATERLRVNLPATIVDPSTHASSAISHPSHNTPSQLIGASGSQILLATENFITFLDALKLNMLSKDALHPLLAELIQSVNTVTDKDFEGRAKIINWLIRLNSMRAQEELSQEEARELVFEMEGAYAGFKKTLN